MNKEDREDFKQYIEERKLRGSKATNGQLFIDYLRKYRASKRTKSYKEKLSLYFAYEIDHNKIKDNFDYIIHLEFNEFVSLFDDKIERVVLVLRFYWGLSLKEVGFVIGCGEANTHLIIDKIFKKINQFKQKKINNSFIKYFLVNEKNILRV